MKDPKWIAIPLPSGFDSISEVEEAVHSDDYYPNNPNWITGGCDICQWYSDEILEHGTICDCMLKGVNRVFTTSNVLKSWDDIWYKVTEIIVATELVDYLSDLNRIVEGKARIERKEYTSMWEPNPQVGNALILESNYILIKSRESLWEDDPTRYKLVIACNMDVGS